MPHHGPLITANDPMYVPFEQYVLDLDAHRQVTNAAVEFARQLSAEILTLKTENAYLRDALTASKGEPS